MSALRFLTLATDATASHTTTDCPALEEPVINHAVTAECSIATAARLRALDSALCGPGGVPLTFCALERLAFYAQMPSVLVVDSQESLPSLPFARSTSVVPLAVSNIS